MVHGEIGVIGAHVDALEYRNVIVKSSIGHHVAVHNSKASRLKCRDAWATVRKISQRIVNLHLGKDGAHVIGVAESDRSSDFVKLLDMLDVVQHALVQLGKQPNANSSNAPTTSTVSSLSGSLGHHAQ